MDSPCQASSLSPENQLLYYSSFPKGNGPPQEKVVPLASQVKDWGRLLAKATFHRLQPRLYLFLKRHDAPSFLLPEDWKKIESTYHWAQAYTLSLEAELSSVLLPEFNQAEIEVLLLKGAALAQTVYRTEPVRFFVDLDLLIRPEALSRVQALLSQLGYRPRLSHFPSQWHERELGPGPNRIDFSFAHPERRISLDLHVEAFEAWTDLGPEPEWLWKDARTISVGESHALLPDPNHLFLHLLFHLAKHAALQQTCLAWYLDLSECLHYYGSEIDEHYCLGLTQKIPHTARILEALAFLQSHFAFSLPPSWAHEVNQRTVRVPSLNEILNPLKKSELDSFRGAEGIHRREHFLFHWSQVSGLRKKIWFLLRWFLPDREYLETKYGARTPSQKAGAYFKHWVLMGLKGGELLKTMNLLARRGAKV